MNVVVSYRFSVVPEGSFSRDVKEVNLSSYYDMDVSEAWSMFKDEFTGSPRSKSRGFRNRGRVYKVVCHVARPDNGAGWVPVDEKVFGKLPPRDCWWAD